MRKTIEKHTEDPSGAWNVDSGGEKETESSAPCCSPRANSILSLSLLSVLSMHPSQFNCCHPLPALPPVEVITLFFCSFTWQHLYCIKNIWCKVLGQESGTPLMLTHAHPPIFSNLGSVWYKWKNCISKSWSIIIKQIPVSSSHISMGPPQDKDFCTLPYIRLLHSWVTSFWILCFSFPWFFFVFLSHSHTYTRP